MAKMIKRLLIANRGEIARRIQRSCRELGIETVALFTEGEEQLPHVKEADYSRSLGSGPLSETYLNQKKLIEVAKELKCEAIHPGYGFLSEKASFAQAVTKAGLIFVGPSPEVIELMGDKQRSKQKMSELQVPLIPGYHGDNQDAAFLKKEAQKIGLPLLIKASAGGGGKGMRIVREWSEFDEALGGAKREAMNAFGDDKVLLERYLVNPRHIEIQVFSDSHGNHLHLFERECSLQRRYQKIIEEAPSVALDQQLRQKMGETATRITRALGYRGAGTLEFMLDQSGEFFFLEMNTRLQVEHPVTELITGVDLVAWQLREAMGQPITTKQEELQIRGHALEVRLYAEDPDQDFLPCTGKLERIGRVQQNHCRMDTGYEEGHEVSTSFDPMIAKLICWGEDRGIAIARMDLFLQQIGPLGITTNQDYLRRLLHHPAFIKGELSTDFVKNHQESLKAVPPTESELARAMAIRLLLAGRTQAGQSEGHKTPGAWEQIMDFRLGGHS